MRSRKSYDYAQRIQEIDLFTQLDNRTCGIAEHIIQTSEEDKVNKVPSLHKEK